MLPPGLYILDLEAGKEVTGKHGEKVKIDQAISDADAKEFDALLIPGGFSPDLLRGDDRPGEFTKAFVEKPPGINNASNSLASASEIA